MLKTRIIDEIKKFVPSQEVILDIPEIDVYGDYSTNIAIIIAKKEGKSPQEVARRLVEDLQKDYELSKIFSETEAAGPGFINFFLSQDTLLEELSKAVKDENYGFSNIGNGKCVLVEYSSPNI